MIESYILRKKYIDRIIPFINKNVIKIFTGHRRVGKSCMLFQIIDILRKKNIKNEEIIYINRELPEFLFIETYKDLISYVMKKKTKKKKYYLFIDEIQEIENFEKALNSLFADNSFDIYCTGSNAYMLSGELATYLSGRYIEIKIFSLSYEEFLIFNNLEARKESFEKYIKYGGLPYLKNLILTDDVVYNYLINIYSTILFKDIVKRYNIRNVDFLERMVLYIAENTGSIISAKKISDFLKSQRINISVQVVINYLKYLTDAFFLFKLSRSEVQGKKVFEIGEKYYFEDLGLRHSIIGYKQTDIQKILENIVLLHLKIEGFKVTVGKLYNYEIDFVCEKAGEKIYIQVAYLLLNEKTIEREFGNLLKIKDNYRKIVVSMDDFTGKSYNGIEHIKIEKFLLSNIG